MGHDHPAATVSLAAQLVHRVATKWISGQRFPIHKQHTGLPIGYPVIFYELQVALPEISCHLRGISWWAFDTRQESRTLPQEKQRIGMIILTLLVERIQTCAVLNTQRVEAGYSLQDVVEVEEVLSKKVDVELCFGV